MQITFTNTTPKQVFVSAFYKTLEPAGTDGDAVTTSMSASQYDGEQLLKSMVEDGTLTITFLGSDPGDSTSIPGYSAGPAYDNATRPSPTVVPLFTSIWNTDDDAPNYSDGTNWRDAAGIIT